MENKKLLPAAFIYAVFSAMTLCAQNAGSVDTAASGEIRNYYIKQDENGVEEIVQRLSWEYIPDILEYEVVIEQNTSSEDQKPAKEKSKKKASAKDADVQETSPFTEIYRTKTPDNFLEITLKAGSYRYRVTVYNLLGKEEAVSDWSYFDIIKAYPPEVRGVLPRNIFLEEINDGKFSLSGKNLFSDSIYSLRKNGKSADKYIGQLAEHDDENKKAVLQFDMKDLDVGTYNLTVTNPGGLSANDGPITIRFKKMMDFDVSGGYAVPVALYDDTFKTYLNTNTFPISIAARCSFMPFKHRFGYLGLGLSATYSRIFAIYDDYTIDGNFMTGFANFVYQLPVIKNRITLEAHGGAGVVFFNDVRFKFGHDIVTDPLNSIDLAFDAGGAVQVYVLKRLYVDICADYVQAFIPDMSLGMIVPSVSVGWQF